MRKLILTAVVVGLMLMPTGLAQSNYLNPFEWFTTKTRDFDMSIDDPTFDLATDLYIETYGIDCSDINQDGSGSDVDFCEDALGTGGGESKWVDGGTFLYPNSTFADNIIIYGFINASDWSNVTITESQISDLKHIEGETKAGAAPWQSNTSTAVIWNETKGNETYFTNISNFTGTLTESYYCTYSSAVPGIVCNTPPTPTHVYWNSIAVDLGSSITADRESDTLTFTSVNQTILIDSNIAQDKVKLSVNQTYPFNFTHENASMTHNIISSGHAINTEYRNNGLRPIIVYGSVQFAPNQYCVAYSGASSPPTTTQQPFGPAAAAGYYYFPFSFVVPSTHYYNITCVGGTLQTWFEVVL